MLTAPLGKVSYAEIEADSVIDIVEGLVQQRQWTYERSSEDQIIIHVKGDLVNHTVAIEWSESESSIRLTSMFDVSFKKRRMRDLYELLNLCNQALWFGSFVTWLEQGSMIWRYAQVVPPETVLIPEYIDEFVQMSVLIPNRFVPAFWSLLYNETKTTPEAAFSLATSGPVGRA